MRLAVIAASVMLAWALPSAVARAAEPDIAGPAVAGISVADRQGLTKAERTRRAVRIRRALRKCRTIRRVVRRKACARNVRRAARRLARKSRPITPAKPVPEPGRTWRIDVVDKVFNPAYLEVEAGDVLMWVWNDKNKEAHDVRLEKGPAGVRRTDFMTPNAPSVQARWSRRLDVPGTWTFFCSMHHLMKMTVKVRK